jgi:hypothetical protein
MALISKLFQNNYRKAREGRAVKMDERLFFDSVATMRLDFASGIPFPLSGATLELDLGVPLFSLDSKLLQSSRVPPLVDKATSGKVVIKQISSARGFLRRAFLNSSSVGQVSPN